MRGDKSRNCALRANELTTQLLEVTHSAGTQHKFLPERADMMAWGLKRLWENIKWRRAREWGDGEGPHKMD